MRAGALAAAFALLAACSSTGRRGSLAALRPGEEGFAVLCAKVLTVDGEDHVYSPGMILVRESKIAYVGERATVPSGYRVLDLGPAWATPGMVELHSHIHTGGWGDINDMVIPVNPEFRASAGLRPSNPQIKVACAGGVTTLFGIPGSGTIHSGFGVIYKAKTDATYADAVVKDPGGMKVAQSYNPERRAGDLGLTRAGLGWILEDVNERAIGANREKRFDPALANLEKVHRRELPVLIHCVTRDGSITGTVAKYLAAGAKDISVNTDSPVMPEEELFLQGTMSARLGADPYTMLRACTIHPAKVFGIDDRVGSLEPGKDADIVLHAGDPLDPRARVELVLIDGRIEYDARKGQWF
jgi:imidazolonepropionase-like amidohydrolase